MVQLSSFFSLSSIIFVLYSCRPTAARINCPGYAVDFPSGFPNFPTLLHMCARRKRFQGNLDCFCTEAEVLICGFTGRNSVIRLINQCFDKCTCGAHTRRDWFRSGAKLTYYDNHAQIEQPLPKPIPQKPPQGTHTCSGSCTSVNLGCASQSHGECNCFAPPVSLFYWHQGNCGTRLPFKSKRDLVQQRLSYYLNATAKFASSNKATAPPGPVPDHAAQLASGLLPSPCNASYVSFACSDSPDGIVHEPPQSWLGALLPEGATEIPPMPKEFVKIHGL